jgi:hypothetical protein
MNEVEICNIALGNLGVTAYITSLDEAVKEAETCKVYYNFVRERCLASFPWPFATLRAVLAELAEEPTRDGWAYIYGLPAGCLQERKIWPVLDNPDLEDLYGEPVSITGLRNPRSDQRVPFAVEKSSLSEGRVLLCDLPDPVLFYTADVVDPVSYPTLFVDAFSWWLAHSLALPLTGKVSLADRSWKAAMLAIAAAQAAAMNGQQEDVPPECELIATRWY